MNRNIKDFFKIISSSWLMMLALCLVCDTANAARTAIRGTAVTAKRTPVTTTATPVATTVVESVIPEPTPEPEPVIETITNKAAQFDASLSESISSSQNNTNDLAEQIRKQRAAFEARENAELVKTNQNRAMSGGQNICDSGLRECIIKECGNDFTKCTMDGDTLFGEKLNRCRRDTVCNAQEFKLFTTEIRADRDMNARLASYNSVIDCGNRYKSCIANECGATFEKCLGQSAANRATEKCASIATQCKEHDSGLSARFGNVIGRLRESAEIDIKTDEKRLYDLRDAMRQVCDGLGAMFDERSLDCVYTVNFFAGDNQSTPMASRKLYAGDTFTCTQEWFGINVTTYKENAYRETRAQTGASSAMFGSGVGTAVGLVTSGAIGRGLDTQKAKKALVEKTADERSEPTNQPTN